MIAVTKLIDLLDKPALVYWSNKLGLKGISISDYYKETSAKGTKKHNEVEEFLLNGVLFDGYKEFQKSILGYEVIGVEKEVKNDFLIGRIDLILKKDNLIYIVDLKRNKKIYLKTKLQLSCYKHIYKAHKICYMNFDSYKLIELNIDTNKYYEIVKRLWQIKKIRPI